MRSILLPIFLLSLASFSLADTREKILSKLTTSISSSSTPGKAFGVVELHPGIVDNCMSACARHNWVPCNVPENQLQATGSLVTQVEDKSFGHKEVQLELIDGYQHLKLANTSFCFCQTPGVAIKLVSPVLKFSREVNNSKKALQGMHYALTEFVKAYEPEESNATDFSQRTRQLHDSMIALYKLLENIEHFVSKKQCGSIPFITLKNFTQAVKENSVVADFVKLIHSSPKYKNQTNKEKIADEFSNLFNTVSEVEGAFNFKQSMLESLDNEIDRIQLLLSQGKLEVKTHTVCTRQYTSPCSARSATRTHPKTARQGSPCSQSASSSNASVPATPATASNASASAQNAASANNATTPAKNATSFAMRTASMGSGMVTLGFVSTMVALFS